MKRLIGLQRDATALGRAGRVILLCLASQIAFASSPATVSEAAAPPIQFGMAGSNDPWTHSTDEGVSEGYAVEMVSATLAELGYTVHVMMMPPRRVNASLNTHRLSGAIVLEPRNKKLNLVPDIVCTPIVLEIPWGLYTKRERALLPEAFSPGNGYIGEQGRGVVLGVLNFNHFEGSGFFDEQKTVYFSNSKLLYRALKADRIDGLISSPVVAAFWQKQLAMDLEAHPPWGRFAVRNCFSRVRLGQAAEKIAAQFNQTMYELLDHKPWVFSDGALEAIRRYDGRKIFNTELWPQFEK